MSYRVDLHTHSVASPDGSLDMGDFRRFLERGFLDCIAITDHNTIEFAREAQRLLGEKIIVGEEISTRVGEVIGLYLQEAIPPGLSLVETVVGIKAQGGLVYVPHPFETVRSGLSHSALFSIADEIDIIELYNGRALFQNRSEHAVLWARQHHTPGAASSDAHGLRGWGRTYSVVQTEPTRRTLAATLADPSTVHYHTFAGMLSRIVYPKLNRLRKRGQHV